MSLDSAFAETARHGIHITSLSELFTGSWRCYMRLNGHHVGHGNGATAEEAVRDGTAVALAWGKGKPVKPQNNKGPVTVDDIWGPVEKDDLDDLF